MLKPAFKHVDHVGFFIRSQRAARGYSVPFFQASTAAAGRCMLCDKYRVAPERRLFPIIFDHRRRQAFCDKVSGMNDNRWQAFSPQIIKVFALQVEFAAEC